MLCRLFFLVALLLAPAMAQAEDLTREEATGLKTYDLAEFTAVVPEVVGKVLKLRFNSRAEAFEKLDDGTIRGMLRHYDRKGNLGSTSVVVPKEAAEWFVKLPTNIAARATLVVFARVTKTEELGVVVTLLGREMKTDRKGPKVIW